MGQRILTALALVSIAVLLPACFEKEMEFLSDKIEIAANPNLAEWIPRLAYNSQDDEFLVVWSEQGVRDQGESSKYAIFAQRLSSSGEKKGTTFSPAGPPVSNIILIPTPEYNKFTNQFLMAYTMAQNVTGFDELASIFDSKGEMVKQPFPIAAKPKSQMHSRVAFNSKKRQFFVTYNSSEDSSVASPDIKGVIIDEAGTPVGDELIINNVAGDEYNPFIAYNPKNDTYLVNWEDFRNVPTWEQNGEIYGALLDGDGNVLVNDIPMIDDFGTVDEGDQRHNEIAYNPHRNEFFVSWTDMAPSLDNVGIRGRFISADGKITGEVFTIADAAGPQIYPHAVYVPSVKKYFIIWEDGRNEDDPSLHWRSATNLDIYGKWMSSDGKTFSEEIVFCDDPGVQRYSSLSYAKKSNRLLVAWQDIIDEDLSLGETDNQSGQHIKEKGGNVYAIVYGSP
ncbi:MAG: hypothetical protein JW832_08840 [Deltaproteobacteria bacterium]|nr:hypothetical protein [Deltaproteobacteria bacterium]